jgi:hypothetical protein
MKFKIYSIMLILVSIFTISINFVFGDSDFVLELINVNTVPTISNLEIDGENVEELCPTSNCKLEFTNNSTFNPPNPYNTNIAHTIDFKLLYNSTDADSFPIKKESFKKFRESMNSCIIYNVIENNKEKIYFCRDQTNTMSRISDSKVWYYDSIGIYDTIKNTYTVKGDLRDNSTS